MRRSATLAASLVAALWLSGCGGDGGAGSSPEDAVPTVPSGGGSVPEPSEEVTEGLGDDADDLAGLAEELAGEKQKIPPRDGPVEGSDISWPQCPEGLGIPEKRTLGLPPPLPTAEYVVVGLTNGPGFTPNPCLADQVDLLRERGLLGAAYSVSSYPDATTLEEYRDEGPFDGDTASGALRNVGYSQARYNIANMREVGFETPFVWIDVEPVPLFEWSTDTEANSQVILGVARGYEDAGYDIGVYSTPYLWDEVVGDLSLGVPEWRAAGQTSREEALDRCGDDWVIQGGEAVLGQWVADNRDLNVTCPGISADLGRFFHQY